MLNQLYHTLTRYLSEVSYVFQWHWNHMTPGKYIILLISIGIFGYILMKNGVRQY